MTYKFYIFIKTMSTSFIQKIASIRFQQIFYKYQDSWKVTVIGFCIRSSVFFFMGFDDLLFFIADFLNHRFCSVFGRKKSNSNNFTSLISLFSALSTFTICLSKFETMTYKLEKKNLIYNSIFNF